MEFSGLVPPSMMKKHPLTGEAIEPVGFRCNGNPIWPFMGGAPDDGEDDEKNKGGDGTDSGGDDGGSGGSGKPDDSGDGAKDTITREEYEAVKRRMEAADRRASEAERKIQEAENAKKDDLTKATDRVTELESEVESLKETVGTLRLTNAFLSANKHEWHDSEIALDIAQRKGYLEDATKDDGEVDKVVLGKALDRLAKEHAYLLKKEDKGSGGDDDGPGGPSGEPAGGRSDNGKDDQAKKQALKNRFPVLNR